MAEAEHAVATGVVQHGALQRDDPRAAGGEGDVRIHAIVRVEVDVAGLDGVQLRVLVKVEQFGELALDALVFGGGRSDRFDQIGVRGGEPGDDGVIEADGAALAGMGAQGRELVDYGHGSLLGWGHPSLLSG